MRHEKHEEQVRQAKADLKHLEQQSEKMLGAQPVNREFDENDPIEIWGKRIGRGIGYVVVAYLIYSLVTTYLLK